MRDPAEALELETRRRIYQHLLRVPGDHMREIGRALEIPMGTLEYHLHYLVRAGLIHTREDPRYTRYFPTGEIGRREKDVLAVIRQEVPRRIAAFLLLNPGANHGEIHAQFQMSASTLSFHLKKLVAAGIAVQEKVGRENRYTVVEPDLVAKVLVTYRASFVDDVVDRFADVWLALAPKEEPAEEEAAGSGAAGPEQRDAAAGDEGKTG